MTTALVAGFLLGLGLILAIGAQNAFVLRQGLRREHVFAVCLFSAVADATLIGLGVAGFRVAAEAAPWLEPALLWGGIAFLLWMGLKSFRAAFAVETGLRAADGAPAALLPTLTTAAALSLLNPHVYLDTMVFFGSISAQYPGHEAAFGLGGAGASFLFFFSLGYGARLLAPLFARPWAWRILDTLIGLTMWAIAWSLAPI